MPCLLDTSLAIELRDSTFSRRKTLDRMIFATALAHRLTLVMLDRANFADVRGLKLQVWSAPAAL